MLVMDTRGDIHNQSQEQPGRQSNYFQVRPELAGSHRSGRLRPGQTEQEVPGLNTPLNSRPADCQNTRDELRLAAGTIETPPGQQVAGQTYNIVDQGFDQSLVECGERLSGRISVIDDEVENMPRTVQESMFKMVVAKAHNLRAQISKSLKNLVEYVEEIRELEPVESNKVEESDYFLNRWADAEKEL